ncbi:MAG: hypothetical protein WAN43_16140 [Rhodomicrobium sp.]
MKRVVVGDNPSAYGAGYGLWISKPGKAAGSANQSDFLVAPGLNNMLAVLTGTFASGLTLPLTYSGSSIRVTVDSYGDTATGVPVQFTASVSHGLGYVPMIWHDLQDPFQPTSGFVGYAGSYLGFVTPSTADVAPQGNGDGYCYFLIGVDDTNLYLMCEAVAWISSTYGSGWTAPMPTSVTLGRAIHYAIMNAQVA